ncbi:helix-turn-helix domain-containing protein [Enterococcus sp. AZ102]|uniref:helix-turn-helix domain-containing protein n=1 Tax=Enterococcus sp. AZ102 TaxID=2774865 RepID=UPI003F262663
MELSKFIGGKIKQYRETKNITQDELAEFLGTTRQSISRYENGERKTNQDILFDLAEYFDVSINDFFPKRNNPDSITNIVGQLNPMRKKKVYNFAEYQLKEQNKKPILNIIISGYVSAGTGEWLDDTVKEELEYEGVIPEHDFAVKVNGDSMMPMFEDGQVIFIEGTSEARDGQIIVCEINNEAYVKRLSGDRLVSLNKNYSDIKISETDDFKIFGIVVL